MNNILLVTLYGALVVWIFVGIARVEVAWETSQRQTGALRKALTSAGLALMRDLETIEKIEAETAKVKEKAATALREQKDRHETFVKSMRPITAEINVTSEYPTGPQDKAWIIEFVRTAELGRAPSERHTVPVLLWAVNQAGAVSRGRQMAEAMKTYTLTTVRLLDS